MGLIDRQYTARPFYGSRRMVIGLEQQGEDVNRKRVQRLMRIMGLEAIYPKPRLSLEHRRERPVGLFSLDGRPHLKLVDVPGPDLGGYASLMAGVTP